MAHLMMLALYYLLISICDTNLLIYIPVGSSLSSYSVRYIPLHEERGVFVFFFFWFARALELAFDLDSWYTECPLFFLIAVGISKVRAFWMAHEDWILVNCTVNADTEMYSCI